jgi:hypothetical protein
MSWNPADAFLPPLDPPKDDLDAGTFLQQLPGLQEQSIWPVRRIMSTSRCLSGQGSCLSGRQSVVPA